MKQMINKNAKKINSSKNILSKLSLIVLIITILFCLNLNITVNANTNIITEPVEFTTSTYVDNSELQNLDLAKKIEEDELERKNKENEEKFKQDEANKKRMQIILIFVLLILLVIIFAYIYRPVNYSKLLAKRFE